MSLIPWFWTATAVGDKVGEHTEYDTANAWQASTWWAIAVGLAVVAAVAAAARSDRRWVTDPALAATAVALGIVVWQWQGIPGLHDQTSAHGGLGWFAAGPDDPEVGEIVRDNLVRVDIDGLYQDVTWGLYLGIAALAGQCLILAVRTLPSRRPDRPDGAPSHPRTD
ncbi:hypothetical protein Dvina_28560 [Dactylosporangium vinaceum]|uniref:Uncharacterized protein n=1 Tax=Dactylosporangium vinaceum TaxID=53362 RepID=A0ABV5MNW7_9ACTN|nr:hypothetical protein [Dactylosporangium vinaceum]UAB92322.1 hypothetical protein Dvina_28560 [Dactylosporangium vinaceum]